MMPQDPVLRIPWGLSERLRALLHPAPFEERFAFAVARPLHTVSGAPQTALVEQIIPLNPDDYDATSPGGLSLSAESSARTNQWAVKAARSGWFAVHLHSHPHGVNSFSRTDDEAESKLSWWLAKQGVPQYWSVVWPVGGQPRARLWRKGESLPGRLFLGLAPMVDSGSSELSPALDRQRAFGTGLLHAAEQIRVGVVGLGGIGMLVVEQLARAGFKHFVLVDPDTVETTNLNRLPGLTRRDLGRYKARLGKRLIHQAITSLNMKAHVSAFSRDIYLCNHAQNALKGCDLILAVTDNELSRTVALQIALDHGREYLQAGTDIAIGDRGVITGLRAEVTGAETGRYCPLCTGRLSPGQASIEARAYVGGEVAARALSEGYVPDVAAPAVMSLNAVAAGMLVTEIQRRAAGIGVRDITQIDLQSGNHHIQERVTIAADCHVCGGMANT